MFNVNVRKCYHFGAHISAASLGLPVKCSKIEAVRCMTDTLVAGPRTDLTQGTIVVFSDHIDSVGYATQDETTSSASALERRVRGNVKLKRSARSRRQKRTVGKVIQATAKKRKRASHTAGRKPRKGDGEGGRGENQNGGQR